MTFLTKYLPRKGLSYWVGRLMAWEGPSFWVQTCINIFVELYNVNLTEIEKRPEQYKSLGEFFCRKLRPGVRPIASSWAVHPTDSEVIQKGFIHDSKLIQAKGIEYNLLKLTEDPLCHDKFGEGYFITYYLCPTDYHRVHSPVSGFITHVTFVRGDLWPVNNWAIQAINGLYGVNERIIIDIATEYGPVSVILVGALNVGYMTLSFDEKVRGNHNQKSQRKKYPVPIEIKKGDELGMFRMGSTVVVLYSNEFKNKFKESLAPPRRVKVGQALTPIIDNQSVPKIN